MPPKKRAKKPKEVPIPLEVQLEQAIQEREKAKGALTEKDLMMDPKLRKLGEAIGLKKKYRDIPVDVEMDTSQVFTRIKVLGKNQFKKVYLVQGQTDGRYYIFVKDRPQKGEGAGPKPPPPEVEQVAPDIEGLDPEDRQEQQKAEGEGGEGEGGEGDDSEGDGGGEGGESGEESEGEGEGEGSGEGEGEGEGEGSGEGEGEGEGEGSGSGEGEGSDEGEGEGAGKGGESGEAEAGEGQGGGEGEGDGDEGEGKGGGGRPPQQWIGPFTGPDAEDKLFKEMARRAELLKAKRSKGVK